MNLILALAVCNLLEVKTYTSKLFCFLLFCFLKLLLESWFMPLSGPAPIPTFTVMFMLHCHVHAYAYTGSRIDGIFTAQDKMAFRANVKKIFDCIWMGGLPLMCHLSVPAPIGIAESLRSIQRNLTYAILVLPGNTKTAHPARPVRERWKLLLKLSFSHRGHYYMDQVWVAGFFSTLSIAKNEQQNLKTDCFT
jgi:hypothetical protein